MHTGLFFNTIQDFSIFHSQAKDPRMSPESNRKPSNFCDPDDVPFFSASTSCSPPLASPAREGNWGRKRSKMREKKDQRRQIQNER